MNVGNVKQNVIEFLKINLSDCIDDKNLIAPLQEDIRAP